MRGKPIKSTELDLDDLIIGYPELSYSTYQAWYSRREFYSLQSIPRAPVSGGKFEFLPYQEFIVRLLGAHSLQDKLLLFHEVGTGKTITASGVIENLLFSSGGAFKTAYVILTNGRMIQSFVAKLVTVTGRKYLPVDDPGMSEKDRYSHVRRKLQRAGYRFLTYRKFANEVVTKDIDGVEVGKTAEMLMTNFSNSVFVFDEVHHVRHKPDVYKAIHLVLHSVRNCKILAMTGTVIQDRPEEHARIMNLLLPLDRQMPEKMDEFVEKRLGDGMLVISNSGRKKLLKFYESLISVVRAPASLVPRVYHSFDGSSGPNSQLYEYKMSELQSKSYIKAIARDASPGGSGEAGEFYHNSIDAELFVFPDGKWGKEGFREYTNKINAKSTSSVLGPALTDKLVVKFPDGRTDIPKSLEQLGKFSAIYKESIELILKNRGNGVSIIFNMVVSGSGCLLFGMILELFGYTRYRGGTLSTESPRYFILTDATIGNDAQILPDFQRELNSPDNATGSRIQVVITSKIGSEGLDFFHVSQFQAQTMFWNFGVIDQAIGRGFRLGSHEQLQKVFDSRNQPFRVNIYFHSAISASASININRLMFERSMEKDMKNKPFERLMFESAIDCPNNRMLNWQSDADDNSRECHYQICKYACMGITDLEVKEPNNSTYAIWYMKNDRKRMQDYILELLTYQACIPLSALFQLIPQKARLRGVATPLTIIQAINEMVISREPVSDIYGRPCFIHYKDDFVLLTLSTDLPHSPSDGWARLQPDLRDDTSTTELIETEVNIQSMENLKKIDGMKIGQRDDILAILNNLSTAVKQKLVEAMVHKYESGEEGKMNEVQKLIYNSLRDYWWDVSDVRGSTRRYWFSSITSPISYRLHGPGETWQLCIDQELRNHARSEQTKQLKLMGTGDKGYFAIITDKNQLYIRHSIEAGDIPYRIQLRNLKDSTLTLLNGQEIEYTHTEDAVHKLSRLIEENKLQSPELNKINWEKELISIGQKRVGERTPHLILLSKPDMRKMRTGQACGTGIWKHVVLVQLSFYLGLDNPDAGQVSEDEALAELVELELVSPNGQPVQPENSEQVGTMVIELQSSDDRLRLWRLSRLSRHQLCEILTKYFTQNNLAKYFGGTSLR